MKKCFWENPYLDRLNTKVTSLHEDWIVLEKTIIFSFSGGQESDKATINKMPVLESKIVEKDIFYKLQDNHGLMVGSAVQLEIDWGRRYRLMRLHFAAELILELVTRKLDAPKIGAHIAENKARIDFTWHENISKYFIELLTDFKMIINQDHQIKTGYLCEKDEKRYWEIEGFSKVPCGGTHVKSTKEIGYVKLKRVNIGKAKERIEIALL